MPSKKNIDDLNNLKEKLAKAKAVVLADYCGLTVEKMNQLRNKVKQAGGELKVIKNTILKLGFKDLNLANPDLENAFLGPTAILFNYEDEIAPLKALYDFYKENDLPKLKVGFLGKDFLGQAKIIELAQLPSKEVLQGKLVAIVITPLSGMVYALKANLQGLLSILSQLKDKKDAN